MIITMFLNLIISIFGFISILIGGMLPSLPTELKTVLDGLFIGLQGSTSFLALLFDINLVKALITFWLIVWSLQHVIEFIVWIIFGRAKVDS